MNGMHGIIFSYEKRNDLRELGEIRSASSIPFGGRYRAVDFALSNLVNAGVTDVGVVLHGHYQSLLDHLGTGKDWDLSRKRGGLKILPPFAYKQHWGEAAVFRGKMEALAGVRSYLEEIRRDYVVLMDGDLVVNLPLSDIYDQHIKSGADITVVCGNDSFETENGTYFELDGTGPRHGCVVSPPPAQGLPGAGSVHPLHQAAAGSGGRVRHPGSVQPAAGRAPGPEGQPEAPGIHLGRLRGADPLCTGVLRPQYAAAGPGHPGGAVLCRAAHPGQGH